MVGSGTRSILTFCGCFLIIFPSISGPEVPWMKSTLWMSSTVMSELITRFSDTISLKDVALGHPICFCNCHDTSAPLISATVKCFLFSATIFKQDKEYFLTVDLVLDGTFIL